MNINCIVTKLSFQFFCSLNELARSEKTRSAAAEEGCINRIDLQVLDQNEHDLFINV